jgi:hypothetical protein
MALPDRHAVLFSKVVGTGSIVAIKHMMKMSLLEFKRFFWTGGNFYKEFMGSSLGDEEITVSDWELDVGIDIAGRKLNGITRTIKSKHPLAISFPVYFKFRKCKMCW